MYYEKIVSSGDDAVFGSLGQPYVFCCTRKVPGQCRYRTGKQLRLERPGPRKREHPAVTVYWFDGGAGYFHYGDGNTMHTFEAHAGYDFGFLAIDWYTNFAGNTGYRQNGAKAYASYFSISAPFDFAGLGWKVTAGATPWQNDFYNGGSNSAHAIQAVNGFAVCEVSIRALKNFCILKEWQTSAYVQLTWNPTTEAAHLIAGICL